MDVSQTPPAKQVRKRDGKTLQAFDATKIRDAVRKAWLDCEPAVDDEKVQNVVWLVEVALHENSVSDVEKIQDLVEIALMRVNPAVAKAYILYRQKRAEARSSRRHPDPLAVSSYVHAGKYARYLPELRRREVYAETVLRDKEMHLRRFPHLAEEIEWAFGLVAEKRLLPSMRSMQFGGKAIETNNARGFNCSATFIDRPRAFAEALFLLLSGCGVGYSVQFEHVDRLPALKFVDEKRVVHHEVEDTIEGWADALDALVNSYIDGHYLEISFAKIRPIGSPLKMSGGRAPGHLGLKKALKHVRDVLRGAEGRKIRPIEAHRILCHAADAVLSGGVRRSAMIALFSLEDSEMMYAKTGDWFKREPWFANANNSVMLKRGEVKEKQFKRIFQMTREFGEPGFAFCADYDYAHNPCMEIGLNPKLVVDAEVMAILEPRYDAALVRAVATGDVFTGWSFCNLCEMNAAMFISYEDFERVAKAATFIGTLQAAYTAFPYLGWVSEVIAKREALLGIGMTGMMDAPAVALNPEYQRKVATKIVEWNREYAMQVGVRPAARLTTVKPSGTTSLELGCVGSGHHAHHARRYIRRIVANETEAVFQHFRLANPHMCVRKPNGDWVIEFPVEAPEGAVVKADLTAIGFLDMVKSTQQNWVVPGTARPESSPGLTHNVSNTVQVNPEEWDEVAEYLWKNCEFFTGVSLLPATGDKDYAFAPNEAVVTEADEARWNQLLAHYKPVDYTKLVEDDDNTATVQEPACAGGACDLPGQ